MNLAKLPLYYFVIACFLGLGVVAAVKLPEGAPRFIATGALVVGAVLVAVKSVRDYEKAAKDREAEYLRQRLVDLQISPDSPAARQHLGAVKASLRRLQPESAAV